MGPIKYFAVALFLIVKYDCLSQRHPHDSSYPLKVPWFNDFCQYVNRQSKRGTLRDLLKNAPKNPASAYQQSLDKILKDYGSARVKSVRSLYNPQSNEVNELIIESVKENDKTFSLRFLADGALIY